MPKQPPLCPSAQPEMQDSVLFAVVDGTVEESRLNYLPIALHFDDTPAFTPDDVKLTEVFRFAAPCAGGGCKHFDGSICQLASRAARGLPEVTHALPPCPIRADCRWWQQEGKEACRRCPQVVTETYYPSQEVRQIADPMAGAS